MTVLGITVDVIQAAHMRANLVTLGGGGAKRNGLEGGGKVRDAAELRGGF